MSANQEDLPSTTTTSDKHNGGRSGSKPTTTNVADPSLIILQAVNDMLAYTHIDNGKSMMRILKMPLKIQMRYLRRSR